MIIDNVVPGPFFPVSFPLESMLEKLCKWNVKRYQQYCTKGEHASIVAMFFPKIVHVLIQIINNRHNFYTSGTVLAWHLATNLRHIRAFPQFLFTFQCHISIWLLTFFQQKEYKV